MDTQRPGPACPPEDEPFYRIDPEAEPDLHPEAEIPAEEAALYTESGSNENEFAENTTVWD